MENPLTRRNYFAHARLELIEDMPRITDGDPRPKVSVIQRLHCIPTCYVFMASWQLYWWVVCVYSAMVYNLRMIYVLPEAFLYLLQTYSMVAMVTLLPWQPLEQCTHLHKF